MRIINAIRKRFDRNGHTTSGEGNHQSASIVDFSDKSALVAAMMGKRCGQGTVSGSVVGSSVSEVSEESSFSSLGDPVDVPPVEWTLPLVETQTTEPQSMEEEMKRLDVLNSYFVLDSQGEAEFDRITKLGANLFDVPICLISLVDLGRQWFLSRVGLDAAETPRKHAFCAHVILNKYKILIVPDATKDFRFKENPLVTDGIKIRFYAGAALVSKEGYKLGTVCVISPNVRPQGLNAKEQEMLHDLASMAINCMEARRTRLMKEEYETKFHSLARTFLDTTHHLEECKGLIEKVITHNSWGLDKEEYEALSSAAQILSMQSKMCTAAMGTTLQDTPLPRKKNETDNDGRLDDSGIESVVETNTDMKKLFDNINAIVSSFPRHDAVTVEIDKSVPSVIGCDDLLLFRAILNMLTQCIGASAEGEACGIRIRRMKRDEDELLVQCLQGGKPISRAEAKAIFDNKDTLLAPVASIIRSMGGHYGMYEARWKPRLSKSPVQSIFWFQVPYDKAGNSQTFNRDLKKIHAKPETNALEKSNGAVDEVKMDPFQKALIASGCGRVSVK